MAIGGHNSYARKGQSTTEIYSERVGRWLPGPEMPRARFGHKALNYNDEIYVFGGEINAEEASILRLNSFQGQWESIGQMINPVRMKFIALESGNEAFLYGGKCEKAASSDLPSWAACDPMAEVFNFQTLQSSPFNYTELPGNLEASAIILDTPSAIVLDPPVEEVPEITARTFKAEGLDDEMAALFAEFESEEEEENSFMFDFIPSDAQFELMNEEEDASLTFDDSDIAVPVDVPPETSSDAPLEAPADVTVDAPLEVAAVMDELSDTDKDGNPEAERRFFLAPQFTLTGNVTEIIDSLIRRYGEPVNDAEMVKLSQAINVTEENIITEVQPSLGFAQRSLASASVPSQRITINGEEIIFGRSSFQCWSCDARNPTDCLNNGGPVVCPSSQQSCVTFSEKQNGVDVAFRTGCSIESVCLNQKRQNYIGANLRQLWKYNQCKPTATRGSSTCNQCCATTLCNDMNSFDEATFDWEA